MVRIRLKNNGPVIEGNLLAGQMGTHPLLVDAEHWPYLSLNN